MSYYSATGAMQNRPSYRHPNPSVAPWVLLLGATVAGGVYYATRARAEKKDAKSGPTNGGGGGGSGPTNGNGGQPDIKTLSPADIQNKAPIRVMASDRRPFVTLLLCDVAQEQIDTITGLYERLAANSGDIETRFYVVQRDSQLTQLCGPQAAGIVIAMRMSGVDVELLPDQTLYKSPAIKPSNYPGNEDVLKQVIDFTAGKITPPETKTTSLDQLLP